MGDFRMPSLGADMDEGTLLEWLVRPGDPVHRGDVVAVVDTSKAAIEVECFEEGVVDDLLVQPGTRVPVGTPLARISTDGAVPAAVAPTPITAAPPPVTVPQPHDEHVTASPWSDAWRPTLASTSRPSAAPVAVDG